MVKLPRLVIKGILVTLFVIITGKIILQFSRTQKIVKFKKGGAPVEHQSRTIILPTELRTYDD